MDPAGREDTGGLARLMAQVQADEAQRDRVAGQDPALRANLIELLALYHAMNGKLAAMADSSLPSAPAPAPSS